MTWGQDRKRQATHGNAERNCRDTEGAAELFAEDLDFSIPHHPDVWWIPTVRRREELRDFLTGLSEHLETLEFAVDHILAAGSEAVVLGRITDRVRRSGKAFSSPFSLHLSAADDPLTPYVFLGDSSAVHEATRPGR